MKTFKSLQEAQAAQDAGTVFTVILRVTDTLWQAYEPKDPVPVDNNGVLL